MSFNYSPGQRLHCLADPPPESSRKDCRFPIKGIVYTIREIYSNHEKLPFVRLVEIKNPDRDWGKDGYNEVGFPLYIFAPVEDKRVGHKRSVQ